MLNRAGYDIKYHHPYFDILLKKYQFETVLDIGANAGQFAKDIRGRLPKAKIISFEPLHDCFSTLQSNMKDDKNWEAMNIALGKEAGEVEMNKSAFSPSSSLLKETTLLKQIYPKNTSTEKEKIVVKKLDDVFPRLNVKKPFLVKMDVQGFEDRVISGGQNALKEATMILIETNFEKFYENQPLFGDIHEQLRALGFSYHGNSGQHWNPKTGEVLYEDSIFLK